MVSATVNAAPSYSRNGALIPLTSSYALRDEHGNYSVFVISRKLDGQHDSTSFGDGYRPVTLHKLAHPDGTAADPRENNIDQTRIAIVSHEIDLSDYSPDFPINRNTGGSDRGMPPGSVYLYTYFASCPAGSNCGDSGESCTVLPDGSACNDGLYCTSGAACAGGRCTGGVPRNCDDADVCTDDWCNGVTDACDHAGNTARCNDGDVCTLGDTCAAGTCVPGSMPANCDDSNPCTTDSCDSAIGCVNAGIPTEAGLCFAPGVASIVIRDVTVSRADQLTWKWARGDAFAQDMLGNPDVDTTYALCVYDTSASVPVLAASVVVAPSKTSWRSYAPNGWSYSDRDGTYFGVQRLLIKPGATGRRKITLTGSGIRLPLPGPAASAAYFDQDPSVVVQLLSSGGQCWTSEFIPDRTSANTAASFKATAR